MQPKETSNSLSNFYMAGINYEKTDSTIRSRFAISDKAYERLAIRTKKNQTNEWFILSTCNRTEIYGFATDENYLIELLCCETKGPVEEFKACAEIYRGEKAVGHLFEVACGLKSQILGDFEITSQVRHAARIAKALGLMGTFTERLVDHVLQASKKVKNETRLSSGTVSVSFAVVQYLKYISDIENKNILLLGLGKIGCNTCDNLMSYLNTGNVTVMNRTEKKAQAYAARQGIHYAPFNKLSEQLEKNDIVLVATNAQKATLQRKDICHRNKYIIDLSIPHNVSNEVRGIPGLCVLDVDELSQAQDRTLEARKKEVRPAKTIIEGEVQAFLEWYNKRKNAIILAAVKEKMEYISRRAIKYQHKETQANIDDLEALSQTMVQKMLNVLAGKLNNTEGKADFYYRVLGELFEIQEKEHNESQG